ncbi:Rrg1p SCDLUD_001611 [Saccharomycodes ludwigii]|uniref:Rrg1p n=1 Tax=Saccharomycodes ludwigii TaxID=36035 RepID=UPI001E8AB171|nr:hypothetical protein SCDLUD_001611 [Saccharomycodes ludwigii]KAH3901828.1 hypothetical protein SCDLUD_001611 [Saccharomycodes ludwigii]
MSEHFSLSPSIHIYRTFIRDIKLYIFSNSLQNELKKVIKVKIRNIIKQKKGNKIFTELHNLQSNIRSRKLDELKSYLYLQTTKSIGENRFNLSKDLTANININNSKFILQNQIYNEYLKDQRRKLLIPPVSSNEILTKKLLWPLAMHEHYLTKLQNIERKIRNPPKTYLRYTSTHFGKIWFVMSPLNKKKRQSPKLTNFIVNVKKNGQKWIDEWDYLISDVNKWTVMEAYWESMLGNYEHDTKLHTYQWFVKESSKILGAKEHEMSWKNPEYKTHDEILNDWMTPILANFMHLNKKYESYRNMLINYKENNVATEFNYFQEETMKMYEKRKKKFDEMLETALPLVNPYSKERNLESVLKNYLFLPNKC